MNILGICPVDRGWSHIANDYREVIRREQAPIVQSCAKCNAGYWPPRLRCSCGSAELNWSPAGQSAKMVACVGVDLAPGQAASHWVPYKLAHRLPYTTAIVELDDWEGVRLAALADGLSITQVPRGSKVALSAEVTDKAVTLIVQALEA
jgi:uncharacterized OB-fold protein